MQDSRTSSVSAEVAAEVLDRMATAMELLRRYVAAREGRGPYAGIDPDLVALAPKMAFVVLRQARRRLDAELAENPR